jgi:NAD(P)-dependent dehydrogenase (short-subunit alcohol dehydrogenase family)
MPAIDFNGQVAIVTGAGSGIGRATALLLAARGARVLINDCGTWQQDGRPVGRADAVVREILAHGGDAVAENSPVGTRATAERIVEAALQRFGRIDVLINNAGLAKPGAFNTTPEEHIDQVMAVNLSGPMFLMRTVWPTMCGQRYGRIVNLCSSAALGSGISGPYAISKGGVLSLTKDTGIAGQRDGILVNAVMPCAYTPLLDNHPDRAFREWMQAHFPPESVAAVIAFLASREMSRSAEIFTAGGGRVARLAFLESQGYFNAALSPEHVGDNFERICDLTGGAVLLTQDDHQAQYAKLFPRR